jgi:penicillin-binding protein 2
MFQVVNEQGATAYGSRFNLNGMKMAGKTATTQVRRITKEQR